jgi:hypothetical protein
MPDLPTPISAEILRQRSTHLDLNEQELKNEAVWLHTGGWNPPGSNLGGRAGGV